jgi:GNAT superfamily N-acetyltransferase
MTERHRLRLRAEITIDSVDPDSPDARQCLLAYAAELNDRFPEGFDPSELVQPDQVRTSGGEGFVVSDGRPLGCGILRPLDGTSAEIKHLWLSPQIRGRGVGRLLLAHIERRADALGIGTILLDSHRALTEAAVLYRHAGYTEIPPYGANPHAHIFFEKNLSNPSENSTPLSPHVP